MQAVTGCIALTPFGVGAKQLLLFKYGLIDAVFDAHFDVRRYQGLTGSQGSINLQDGMGKTLQHIDLTTLPHKAHTLWVATLYRQGFDWWLTLHDGHIKEDKSPLTDIITKLPKKHDTQTLATLVGQRLF